MMGQGWFKLHRQFMDSDFWTSEPFTKPQAWIDLIGLANHKPGSAWIRGVEVKVKRGQTARSELTLAKRWKWSRKKVRNFLKWLEKEHQIEQQKSNVTSLISIVNYDHYQGGDTAKGTAEGTTKEQQKNTKGYTNKNDKKKKNINNADSSESASCSPEEFYKTKTGKKLTGKRLETFNLFWSTFNFKKGKSSAADSWLKIPSLTDAMVREIISAAEIEASRRPELIKNGHSPKWAQGWLTERRWEDEDYSQDSETPQPKKTMVYEVTE